MMIYTCVCDASCPCRLPDGSREFEKRAQEAVCSLRQHEQQSDASSSDEERERRTNLSAREQWTNLSAFLDSGAGATTAVMSSQAAAAAAAVRRNNSFSAALETLILTSPSTRHGLPLRIRDTVVGVIRPDILLCIIRAQSKVFVVRPLSHVEIDPALDTPDARTAAIEAVLRSWRDQELFTCLRGWRNERYTVWGPDGSHLMQIERAAAGLLGIRAYGCHLNGYVRTAEGEIRMWVARRSATKQTYPSMLDNLVGGGLPHGMTPTDCIVKECFEEAGLRGPTLLGALRCVGMVTYFMDSAVRGWLPDTEFTYDCELPIDWTPQCQDGEVQDFYLMSLQEVEARLMEFTPEAGIVTVDFLIRHGHLTPENTPDYEGLVGMLHRPLPFPGPVFAK